MMLTNVLLVQLALVLMMELVSIQSVLLHVLVLQDIMGNCVKGMYISVFQIRVKMVEHVLMDRMTVSVFLDSVGSTVSLTLTSVNHCHVEMVQHVTTMLTLILVPVHLDLVESIVTLTSMIAHQVCV